MRRNRRAHMRTIAYDEGSAAYVIATVTGSPCLEARWAGVAQFGAPSLFERYDAP